MQNIPSIENWNRLPLIAALSAGIGHGGKVYNRLILARLAPTHSLACRLGTRLSGRIVRWEWNDLKVKNVYPDFGAAT
jgi:hypothetical protein